MRFSLGWLFIAVAVVALGVVALLNANRTWAAFAHSGLIISLSLAIVAAIYTRGASQAFGCGSAIVGGVYYVAITLMPAWSVGDVVRELLYPVISWKETIEKMSPEGILLNRSIVSRPDGTQFDVIMKCVITGVVAVLGGFTAGYLHSRRDASR